MRDITYQAHFLMNYETNTFGVDLIIAITAKSEPYFAKERNLSSEISQNFVDFQTGLESQASYFLIEYYQTMIYGRYKYMNKICTIKELSLEEEKDDIEIIIKKDEDF